MPDKLKFGEGTIFENGYGMIPKTVMTDEELEVESKAIYAYLMSYAGQKAVAFPSLKTIKRELNISKDRFYKHFKPLKEKGYIKTTKTKNEKGQFKHTIYEITIIPFPQNKDMESGPLPKYPDMENKDTNSNSTCTSNNVYIYTVFDYWNSKDIIKHRVMKDTIQSAINSALKNYSPEELKNAIDNYHFVLTSDNYYWTHKYTLKEFLQRGLDKFVDENKPCENFLKGGGPGERTRGNTQPDYIESEFAKFDK